MGYKLQTFTFKIGDAGVSQSDDGSGGTWVSASGSLAAGACETIVNVTSVSGIIGDITPGMPGTGFGLAPDDPPNTWSVTVSYDATSSSYPLAANTQVLAVTAIVAY